MIFKKSSIEKLQAKGYIFLRVEDRQGKCGRINYNIKQCTSEKDWHLFNKFPTSEERDERFRSCMESFSQYLSDEVGAVDYSVEKLLKAGFSIIRIVSDKRISHNVINNITYQDFKTKAERDRFIKTNEEIDKIIILGK
jgi:hypothetical protein